LGACLRRWVGGCECAMINGKALSLRLASSRAQSWKGLFCLVVSLAGCLFTGRVLVHLKRLASGGMQAPRSVRAALRCTACCVDIYKQPRPVLGCFVWLFGWLGACLLGVFQSPRLASRGMQTPRSVRAECKTLIVLLKQMLRQAQSVGCVAE
jgi:hypothetical protein